MQLDFLTPEQPIQFIEKPFDVKVDQAVAAIKKLLLTGDQVVVGTSFGKDSSVLLALALEAYELACMESDSVEQLIVAHSETGYDNPLMVAHVKNEIRQLKAYIKAHNLNVRFELAKPRLSEDYLVQMIGGRTIATFPDNGSKCSMMLKVEPIKRLKKKILSESAKRVVTIVGTRFDESAARGQAMEERGDKIDEAVYREEQGEWVMSPIGEFTQDDIFEFVGLVTSGLRKTYSDFDSLMRFYSQILGECAVVAFDRNKASGQGCGSGRSGCWMCTRVQSDKSGEALAEEHDWLKPLLKIREYIKANHYNPKMRNWLARTIEDDGSIMIAPSSYAPEFCLNLLRYVLTAQRDEALNAQKLGIEPRFEILNLQQIIAIDVLWGRYGYQKGLQACEAARDIFEQGASFYPEENMAQHLPMKFPKEVAVPFADDEFTALFNGFRDLDAHMAGAADEMTSEKGECYTNANTGEYIEVDEEGAELFWCFERDNAIDRYCKDAISPTAGYDYLMRLGLVQINKGGHSEQDRMLRIASQIWRKGLRTILNDPQALIDTLTAGQGSESEPELF